MGILDSLFGGGGDKDYTPNNEPDNSDVNEGPDIFPKDPPDGTWGDYEGEES